MQGTCEKCGTSWITDEFVCCPTCQDKQLAPKSALLHKCIKIVNDGDNIALVQLQADLTGIICQQRAALEFINACGAQDKCIPCGMRAGAKLIATDEALKRMGCEGE